MGYEGGMVSDLSGVSKTAMRVRGWRLKDVSVRGWTYMYWRVV
jgi:hypothetical protein